MEHAMTWVQDHYHQSAIFAPIIFIFFHLIRPFLFIPVALLCITGGLLFGTTHGSIYSFIGVTLSSVFFYLMTYHVPFIAKRFQQMKQQLFGNHASISTPQLIILRITPFVHFHLISLLIIEMTRNFKEYAKLSILSNIPLAVVYTSFGTWFQRLDWPYIIALFVVIASLLYLFRRKEMIVTWQDFFAPNPEK
ncbi:TVP38/TMEM64 family protein [Halalkalibacillus halophilus]|uniref:TVP38/TMEM64 family protein n=1 Tax=Halalkalibacillus halophilus TaxID=392827 RepID=UPI0003FD119E|nr:VTT domain-containing protein [Halalkalibacillus halophilus]